MYIIQYVLVLTYQIYILVLIYQIYIGFNILHIYIGFNISNIYWFGSMFSFSLKADCQCTQYNFKNKINTKAKKKHNSSRPMHWTNRLLEAQLNLKLNITSQVCQH